MSFKAFVKRVKPNAFNLFKDSKINGKPVFDEGLDVDVYCGVCGSCMIYLMQFVSPNERSIARILYIYYCKEHVIDSSGWKLLLYSCKLRKDQDTNLSSINVINTATDWLGDLNLSAPNDNINTSDDGSSSVMFEADPTILTDRDSHALSLYERYKNRNKDEIDEEDQVDYNLIDNMEGDSDDSEDEDDLDSDIEYINIFQSYSMSRPNIIMRYDRNGAPLSFIKYDGFKGSCKSCNSKLTYEFQIMPGIIKYLHKDCYNIASMNLGTILFYTCKYSTDLNKDETFHTLELGIMDTP